MCTKNQSLRAHICYLINIWAKKKKVNIGGEAGASGDQLAPECSVGQTVVSRACETLYKQRDPKGRRFVSGRTAFFGNACCLSNFRELAPAHWTGPLGRRSNIPSGYAKIWEFRPQKSIGSERKKFGMGEFDAAMKDNPHK